MKFLYSLLAFLSIVAIDASAQSLTLTGIDTSTFPIMRGEVYAFDASGAQVSPGVGDLALRENGVARRIISITCPPPAPPRAISSVLVMDVSGSMAFSPNGTSTNMDLAKAAAHAWVAALPFSTSECALTSFDHLNYLNHDFTTDPARLTPAINTLAPQGATDYEMGLYLQPAGGLQVTKRGKHQRVIVFLTDGLPNREPNTADIIAEAQRQNCIVYAVTVNMTCPTSLRDIANGSGGGWYENVTTVAEAEAIYRKILKEVQSGGPCEIVWESSGCPAGARDVELDWRSTTARGSYMVPLDKRAQLLFAPRTLFYRGKTPGTQYDTTVTVTALNADFTVTNITSSNPAFDINPKSFTLAAGASRTVTVSYTPPDIGFNWTAFTLETDLCPQTYYASGGNTGAPPSTPSLKIDHPNGGELFLTRSDTVVRWSGVPLEDPVTLEYSLDNGATWTTITDSAVGGEHPWNVPATPSDQCLARVTHVPGGASTLPFQLLHTFREHTGTVHETSWSPNSHRLLSAGDDGRARVWEGSTGQLLLTLNGHAGQPVYRAQWSPDGSKILTVSADGNGIIWNAATGATIRTLSGHTGPVYEGVWSPDGTMIATASSDNSVKVWNAATGLVRYSFALQSGANALDWHGDNNHLAGAGTDSIFVWRMSDGVRSFGASYGTRFNDVDWNSDGTRLVGATNIGALYLFDGTAGTYLGALPFPIPNPMDHIRYRPNSSTVALAYRDGLVEFINATTGAPVGGIDIHTSAILSIAWSPDGTNFAVASADGTASVWNLVTGAQITTLRGHTGAVTSVSWSHDGTMIGTAGRTDNTVRVWGDVAGQQDVSDALFRIVEPELTTIDVDFGQVPVLTFRDSVVTAFLNNPGSYPVVIDSIQFIGSTTQFAITSGKPPVEIPAGGTKAVELSFRPLSTGPRSTTALIHSSAGIVRATIRGEGIAPQVKVVDDVIDFGRITVGSSKDTIRAVTITNLGSAPLNVTGTRHLGPNDVDFTTVARGGAFTLQPGDTAKLDLRFTASAAGRTSGRLLFDHDAPGSPAVVTLLGEGIELAPLPVVINDMIDFGQVAVGFGKDSLRAVTIANIGTAPLDVTGATHGGPNGADFATLAGDAPFTLLPGDTAKLDFRFSPAAVGPARDTLWFEYEGGSAPLPVVLLGEGIEIPAAATVALPTIEAYAGDTITIPVMLPTQSNLSASTATSFTARMRFNATLLEPIAPTPGGTIEGDERVIELELPLTADADGVVARLLFRAALGDDSTTTLILEDPQSVGGPVAMTSLAGTFRLLGICYEGGARLINPNGTLALKIAEANPTSDHDLSIALETIEAGRTTLRLFDDAGRMVAGFIDEEMAPGIHDRSLDLDGIANGIYILHLQTPSQSRSVIVEIVR